MLRLMSGVSMITLLRRPLPLGLQRRLLFLDPQPQISVPHLNGHPRAEQRRLGEAVLIAQRVENGSLHLGRQADGSQTRRPLGIVTHGARIDRSFGQRGDEVTKDVLSLGAVGCLVPVAHPLVPHCFGFGCGVADLKECFLGYQGGGARNRRWTFNSDCHIVFCCWMAMERMPRGWETVCGRPVVLAVTTGLDTCRVLTTRSLSRW